MAVAVPAVSRLTSAMRRWRRTDVCSQWLWRKYGVSAWVCEETARKYLQCGKVKAMKPKKLILAWRPMFYGSSP